MPSFLSDQDQQLLREIAIWFRSNRQRLQSAMIQMPRMVPAGETGSGVPLTLAQAPAAGIPARVGATPGTATCEGVRRATNSVVGQYAIGDLVKTGTTFEVFNWAFEIVGSEGDRIIKVDGHFDGAAFDGYLCNNAGDPADIKQEQ